MVEDGRKNWMEELGGASLAMFMPPGAHAVLYSMLYDNNSTVSVVTGNLNLG